MKNPQFSVNEEVYDLIDERLMTIERMSYTEHAVLALKDAYLFHLGYEAAGYGERRNWCEQYGPECQRGWAAYWDEIDPE